MNTPVEKKAIETAPPLKGVEDIDKKYGNIGGNLESLNEEII